MAATRLGGGVAVVEQRRARTLYWPVCLSKISNDLWLAAAVNARARQAKILFPLLQRLALWCARPPSAPAIRQRKLMERRTLRQRDVTFVAGPHSPGKQRLAWNLCARRQKRAVPVRLAISGWPALAPQSEREFQISASARSANERRL